MRAVQLLTAEGGPADAVLAIEALLAPSSVEKSRVFQIWKVAKCVFLWHSLDALVPYGRVEPFDLATDELHVSNQDVLGAGLSCRAFDMGVCHACKLLRSA